MEREWTFADVEAAKELGFVVRRDSAHRPFVLLPVDWYKKEPANYPPGLVVDLWVWTLAEEGEPTAIKALDVIGHHQPVELISIYRTVLMFREKHLSDELVKYRRVYHEVPINLAGAAVGSFVGSTIGGICGPT